MATLDRHANGVNATKNCLKTWPVSLNLSSHQIPCFEFHNHFHFAIQNGLAMASHLSKTRQHHSNVHVCLCVHEIWYLENYAEKTVEQKLVDILWIFIIGKTKWNVSVKMKFKLINPFELWPKWWCIVAATGCVHVRRIFQSKNKI